MTDTNPPEERAISANGERHERMRQFGRQLLRVKEADTDAEAISCATSRFLNRHEPDANRRASLWLIGRTWIEEPCDSTDPRVGARAMDRWVRAICPRDRQPLL